MRGSEWAEELGGIAAALWGVRLELGSHMWKRRRLGLAVRP